MILLQKRDFCPIYHSLSANSSTIKGISKKIAFVPKVDSIRFRSDALPMLRWEIEKGHQLVMILLQTDRGLRIFCVVRFYEQIKSFFRIGFALR